MSTKISPFKDWYCSDALANHVGVVADNLFRGVANQKLRDDYAQKINNACITLKLDLFVVPGNEGFRDQ